LRPTKTGGRHYQGFGGGCQDNVDASFYMPITTQAEMLMHILASARSLLFCSSGQHAHWLDAQQRMRSPLERRAPMSTTAMTKMIPGKNLEMRIFQVYVWDLMARRFIDGCRAALLARYGAFEVRLVELLQDWQDDSIPFWIELFDHGSATTIDSYGGYDLEDAAAGAEALISQAKLSHRERKGGTSATARACHLT
jgi:hypothetical protein